MQEIGFVTTAVAGLFALAFPLAVLLDTIILRFLKLVTLKKAITLSMTVDGVATLVVVVVLVIFTWLPVASQILVLPDVELRTALIGAVVILTLVKGIMFHIMVNSGKLKVITMSVGATLVSWLITLLVITAYKF